MVTVRRVETADALNRFVRLPFLLYRNDSNWVPPLVADMKTTLTPGRGPFWSHAERELYLALKDGKVVGRVAAILDRNYNNYHGTSLAFFGFFESEDDQETASALLDAVTAFARARGVSTIYGPANPSLNDEVGLLVDPFDSSPLIKMSYNPAYYMGLVERAGFSKVKDLHAWAADTTVPPPEKLQRVMTRLRKKPGVEVRPFDMNHIDTELALVKEVYNDAWSKNWDFAPMTDEEIVDLARQLKPLIKPEICPLVFYKGEIAGMCITLPDYNQVLRKMNGSLYPFGWLTFLIQRRKINQVRLWALGVKRKFHHLGFDSLMYYDSFMGVRRLGYKWAEISLLLEDNFAATRPLQMMGARIYKTYRVYQRPV